MREFEFRGKRIDNGEWVYGNLLKNINDEFAIQLECNRIENGWYKSVSCIPVDPKTVGQFTGILDKNGKKIFEGDILKCRYYKHAEKDLYLIQKVVYNYATFFVVTNNEEPDLKSDTYRSCPLCWVDQCEIIGNVHENPELLK